MGTMKSLLPGSCLLEIIMKTLIKQFNYQEGINYKRVSIIQLQLSTMLLLSRDCTIALELYHVMCACPAFDKRGPIVLTSF